MIDENDILRVGNYVSKLKCTEKFEFYII
uniref:Uncharacterized protein n=1 Tax=Rhizophora mucronata TaxID=61149 RepID=A0A2P2QH34_RHIMU